MPAKIDLTAIRKWMRKHANNFRDECGEVNTTLMVETWDTHCASGSDTLDPNHPAWDIAASYNGRED